ncbi:MAG: protein kinase domain-containing protein [Gemmatimonadaceae bacterium]|jgi:non-specific serine/threonine protein kinase
MTTLAPGAKLGPYEIESALGAGGMGVVYGARDTRLGRRVAIKVLSADLTRDDTAERRFLKEARTASALDHPNICTIYDIGETSDGLTYLVMAHYDGLTLVDRIDGGGLAVDEAIDITIQLLTGLSRAHAAGIVHRDIKPANIMVTSDGTLKILDFGVAMLTGPHPVTEASDGLFAGTVAYMSPEQATGLTPDFRADLWATGVVLYEMVAGTRPFSGDNLLALAHAIRNADAPPLSGESAVLNAVISRALSKDREMRYQGGEEFVRDLRVVRLGSDAFDTANMPPSGFAMAPRVTAGSASSSADPTSGGGRRTNLPRALPSLIGRDEVLARVTAALHDHTLITLAGFGGVGKTRLAQQVGANVVAGFRHGVWFVDLAGLTAESEALPTIARVLGIREHASESLDITLIASLRDREMLLILDNCERLTEAVASFVERVTGDAAGIRFLATTRSPLGVYGEHVVRVEGLDETAAISLFEERAAQTGIGNTADRRILAELCRRLDYLPLAIELAAARTRSLTPKEILAKVNERLGMLKATDRRAARHQTLEATVGWSYDLLEEPERRLLNRLSVFVGSFDLAAAERVCGGTGIESSDVVDLLDRLVEKSLVLATVTRGVMRFRIMDTVREFAARRLGSAGEAEVTIDKHVQYFATQAQSLGDRFRGADTRAASAAALSDIDNLNAAMDRLGQRGRHTEKARLVTTLDLFWQIGAPSAGRLRFDELVAVLDEIDIDARLSTLIEAASFFSTLGFARTAITLLDRARDSATNSGLVLPPYFYYVGATVAEMDGRVDDVVALCKEGELHLTSDDEFVALSLRTRVLTSIAKSSLPVALEHARTSLKMSQDLGLDLFIAVSHMLIGTVHMLEGRINESEPELSLAVELAGAEMPQVTISALVSSAAGLLRIDPVRSIARAQEALHIEAQSEIMPWFRAIAASIIAWHWANDNRADDAALVLTSMDELEARLGFGGIWWARPIRNEAWDAVRRALPADRVTERALRGRSLTMAEVRELLG